MRPMKPDPGIRVQAVRIPTENGGMSALLLSPLAAPKNAAGILWLHGGGYIAGMKKWYTPPARSTSSRNLAQSCCRRDTGWR